MDEAVKRILAIVTNVHESVTSMQSDIQQLKKGQQEIRDILEPLAKAVDKDAETIVKHDTRITRIEKKLEIAA